MRRCLMIAPLIVAIVMLVACGKEPGSPMPTLPSPVVESVPTSVPLPTATPTPEIPLGGVVARIAPKHLSAAPGDLVVANIEMQMKGVDLRAADLTLSFDSLVIRVVSIEPGGLLGDNPIVGFEKIDQEVGEVRMALAMAGGNENTALEGVLATVELQILREAIPGTKFPLQVTSLVLVDGTLRKIPQVQLEVGEVQVVSS